MQSPCPTGPLGRPPTPTARSLTTPSGPTETPKDSEQPLLCSPPRGRPQTHCWPAGSVLTQQPQGHSIASGHPLGSWWGPDPEPPP